MAPTDTARGGKVAPDVPRLVVLTDSDQASEAGRSLRATLLDVAAAGAPVILFREKDLDARKRLKVARQVAATVRGLGAELVVASDLDLASELGIGLHLAADEAVPDDLGDLLVGRSCHDRDEVLAAVADGCDYVTVSPVAPTESKPGHGPPLGTDGVAELAEAAGTVPVLALGGVTPDNAADFVAAGAHGVAVMGAVIRAKNPAQVVTDLLAAVEPQED
jgi:thiamine-phosphate pyrophosphorylase